MRSSTSAGLRDVHQLGRAVWRGLHAGAIEPGLLADMVILGKDPVGAKPADLMNIPVDITLVGGRIVYERGRPAIAQSDTADLHSGQ